MPTNPYPTPSPVSPTLAQNSAAWDQAVASWQAYHHGNQLVNAVVNNGGYIVGNTISVGTYNPTATDILYATGQTYTEEQLVSRSKEQRFYNYKIWDYFFSSKYGGGNEVKKQKGQIGLEIECEGQDLFNTPLSYWTVHTDGSLRAYKGHSPVEYVLKEPLSRPVITQALDYLDSRLKSAGSKVVMSPRTSVHVHLNCQEYTIKQVYNIVCLYLTVEDLLVEWCGKERVGNLFCLRAKDTDHFKSNLESTLRAGDMSIVCNENLRYSACNMASLKKFGSLEFRSMKGTVDPKLIEQWIDILLSIEKQALKLDNPQEILKKFEELGPQCFVQWVFPKIEHSRLFTSNPNLKEWVWDGIRTVRDIAYAVPLWEEKTEEKPKVSKIKAAYTEAFDMEVELE